MMANIACLKKNLIFSAKSQHIENTADIYGKRLPTLVDRYFSLNLIY